MSALYTRIALATAGLGFAASLAHGLHAEPGAPPPPPPYQMRDAEPAGDRLAPGRAFAAGGGAALFSQHCGYCHLAGGMGTNLLTKQQMMIGQPPQMGLLANRKDLTVSYVKTVVRQGKGAMPPQTRVDITNAELDSVAAYLGKAGQ